MKTNEGNEGTYKIKDVMIVRDITIIVLRITKIIGTSDRTVLEPQRQNRIGGY